MSGAAWLFAPGDRPDRFTRAADSGADHVICDLEDAVAPAHKPAARDAVVRHVADGAPVWVRVNGLTTPWHDDDVRALAHVDPAGVVLPGAESPEDIARLVDRLPGVAVMALVESARGLRDVDALAEAPGLDGLALGTVDLALDLGIDHGVDHSVDHGDQIGPLSWARARLVVAARAAGLPAPVDGVTTEVDAATTAEDARRSRRLGFGGKLCIHPDQVGPVQDAFRPDGDELARARRIVAAATGHGVCVVDGRMVDAPVLERARRILEQA